jgi:hypothetical protein
MTTSTHGFWIAAFLLALALLAAGATGAAALVLGSMTVVEILSSAFAGE